MTHKLAFTDVTCAFCKGTGIDQFNIMSPLSTCVVCHGRRARQLREPVVKCVFCGGTGVYPHTRLTCTACGGVGVRSVPEKTVACPQCGGSGRSRFSPDSTLYCNHCHGAGVVRR